MDHNDFNDPLDIIDNIRSQRYHAIHSNIQMLCVYDGPIVIFIQSKNIIFCNNKKFAYTRKYFFFGLIIPTRKFISICTYITLQPCQCFPTCLKLSRCAFQNASIFVDLLI